MTVSPKVLIADDDASIRLVLSHAFARAGFQVRATGAVAALMKWAAEGEGDILVTDVLMPDENMLEALPRLRRLRPTLPIIVMSAQNTLLTAVAATERGAFEYMPKPFDLDEMVAAARRALVASRPAGPPPRTSRDARPPLAGRSAAMQTVYRSLARLVAVDLPVLITGETGAGKTLAARALHDLGARREAPIVELRMGALAGPELVRRFAEAEISPASGAAGTLVLDEVADLSLEDQTILVGLLDRFYDPATSERVPAPRLVATTTRDLATLCAEGAFRDDLHHRLAVAAIDMPPLRAHVEDIAEISRVVLAPQGSALPERTLDAEALERLKAHDWPGNVRELLNLLQKLCAFSSGPRITVESLERELLPPATGATPTADTVATHLMQAVAAAFGAGRPEPGLHERMTSSLERPLLQSALTACEGNQLRAAELLGLNRNTLRKRLNDLGIKARL